MAAQDKFNRPTLRASVRKRLQDPSGRWWSDASLNRYIDDWQTELNSTLGLVRGELTPTISSSTYTSPSIYLPLTIRTSTGTELPYISLDRLTLLSPHWRWESAPTPAAWLWLDNTIHLWPSPSTPFSCTIEHRPLLSLTNDVDGHRVPAFTKWSCVPYVISKCYLQLGPNFSPQRALKWRRLYDEWVVLFQRVLKSFWSSRIQTLKIGGEYEKRTFTPSPSNVEVTMPSIVYRPLLLKGGVTGTKNGVNTVFTLDSTGGFVMMFKNDNLQLEPSNYSKSGLTITFTTPPQSNDIITVYYTATAGSIETPPDVNPAPSVEAPAGTKNGVNATFTITTTPSVLLLVLNGITLTENTHFTRSGTTITITATESIPQSGDSLVAYYWT